MDIKHLTSIGITIRKESEMIYKFDLNKQKSLKSKRKEITHAKYQANWYTVGL